MRLHCPTCKEILDHSQKPWVQCHSCDRRWLIRGLHATDEKNGLTWCLHLSENDIKGMLP